MNQASDRDCNRDAENESFVGTAIRQQHEPQREDESVPGMHSAPQAGPCSENERSAQCRYRGAPIRIHPVAENAQA